MPTTTDQEHLTLKKYLDITEDAGFLLLHWKDDAACIAAVKSHPDAYRPEHWFPTLSGHTAGYVPPHVKEVCDNCPVRLECLSLAIYTQEPAGVWGGQSIRTIKRMTRKIQLTMRKRGIR